MRVTARLLVIVVGGLLLATLATAVVRAQAPQEQLNGKLRYGDVVSVPSSETVATNLYVIAGTVNMGGTVNGDLVTTGGQISVDGTVNGDIVAAGGQVRIGGTVNGDVRVAGGTVTISGPVTGDVAAAGGTIDITPTAKVGQDVLMSAGRATVSGTIGGSITGSAGSYDRTGTVGGTDTVVVSPAPQVTIPQPTPTSIVLDAVRHYLSVLLFAILALWLFPPLMHRAEAAVREKPLQVIALGLVGFVAYFAAIVVAAVLSVLLAIALGILGFGDLVAIEILIAFTFILALTIAFVIVIGYLSDAVVGFALARLVAGRGRAEPAPAGTLTGGRDRGPDMGRDLGLLAVGAAVVVIVTTLPAIGGLLKLIVIIFGLGAVLYAIVVRPRTPRSAPAGFGPSGSVPPGSVPPGSAVPPSTPPPPPPGPST